MLLTLLIILIQVLMTLDWCRGCKA